MSKAPELVQIFQFSQDSSQGRKRRRRKKKKEEEEEGQVGRF